MNMHTQTTYFAFLPLLGMHPDRLVLSCRDRGRQKEVCYRLKNIKIILYSRTKILIISKSIKNRRPNLESEQHMEKSKDLATRATTNVLQQELSGPYNVPLMLRWLPSLPHLCISPSEPKFPEKGSNWPGHWSSFGKWADAIAIQRA